MANSTMEQLAEDEKENYPLGSEMLKKDRYVDESLSGAHALKMAQTKQDQLINILKSGGFPLHKLAANHQDLLDWLPPESLATQPAKT